MDSLQAKKAFDRAWHEDRIVNIYMKNGARFQGRIMNLSSLEDGCIPLRMELGWTLTGRCTTDCSDAPTTHYLDLDSIASISLAGKAQL